jgi:hypothetical protein
MIADINSGWSPILISTYKNKRINPKFNGHKLSQVKLQVTYEKLFYE